MSMNFSRRSHDIHNCVLRLKQKNWLLYTHYIIPRESALMPPDLLGLPKFTLGSKFIKIMAVDTNVRLWK